MREAKGYKKKPILLLIIVPLFLLLLLEGAVLIGSFYRQGIVKRLRGNAEEITESRVQTRRNGLESRMTGQWMNLGHAMQKLNARMERMLAEGSIDLMTLDQSSETARDYLSAATEDLITMMRANRVTGAFLVLNHEDLSVSMESGNYWNKPGLYLRDLDPNARASGRNDDILLERSPAAVVSDYSMSTDSGWDSCFAFGSNQVPYYDFFYRPMQAALENRDRDWQELAYWSKPYRLEGEERIAIAYSVPLRLESGEVYGVLGVDILLEQLGNYLPYQELDQDGDGAYFLSFQPDLLKPELDTAVVSDSGGCRLVTGWKSYFNLPDAYVYKQAIRINSSIYGDGQCWLGAVLPWRSLNAFSRRLLYSSGVSLLLSLLLGALGSVGVAFWIQKPILTIVRGLRKQRIDQVIRLEKTGIAELDEMTDTLEELSRRLLRERENIRYERDHDFMTGLYNRRAFDREMKILLEEKAREGGIGAYMMMDLDNLKLINDTYGHAFGDHYICAASKAIRDGIGNDGLYSRVSGDEFNVFIYRQDGNRKRVESVIARMSDALYSAYIDLPDGRRQFVRISGGISWYPEEGTRTEELAKKADLAMYVVKRASKEHAQRKQR